MVINHEVSAGSNLSDPEKHTDPFVALREQLKPQIWTRTGPGTGLDSAWNIPSVKEGQLPGNVHVGRVSTSQLCIQTSFGLV